jgi:hypothetical protein
VGVAPRALSFFIRLAGTLVSVVAVIKHESDITVETHSIAGPSSGVERKGWRRAGRCKEAWPATESNSTTDSFC